jgi:hypothetical protein
MAYANALADVTEESEAHNYILSVDSVSSAFEESNAVS